MTQEEIRKKDIETANNFVKDPENRKMAVALANQIQKELGTEWFQAKKLNKVFKGGTEDQIKAKLVVLGMFKLAAYKEEKGQQFYKIDIDQKTQRGLILQEIEFHKAQIEILQEKLVALN